MNEKKQVLPLAIVLLAFALRMWVFSAISQDPARFFQTDSGPYHSLASNLLEYQTFGSPNSDGSWRLETDRTLLYPAFLAGVYALFGLFPAKAMVIQSLLSVVIVALALRLGRIWGNYYVGLLLALLLSLEIGSILYASQVMTETLFNLFFLGALVAWSLMVRHTQWQYGLICGLMLGLGTLVRPALFYFTGLMCLLTLFFYSYKLKYRLLVALTIATMFAIIVAPWVVRNYKILGLAQISTNQNSYMIDAVLRLHAFQQGILFDEARAQIDREIAQEIGDPALLNPGELALYYQQKFLAKARVNWTGYAIFHTKGSLLFFVMPTAGAVARVLGWIPEGGTGLQVNLLNRSPAESWQAFQDFRTRQSGPGNWLFLGALGYELLFLLTINLGMVAGVVVCLWSRRWALAVLAIMAIGYFAAVTGPLAYDARYRLPVVPIMLLLTCLAVFYFRQRTQKKMGIALNYVVELLSFLKWNTDDTDRTDFY